MKIVLLFLTTCTCLFYVQGVPIKSRVGRSTRISGRENELLREVMMCVLQGNTLKECQKDATVRDLINSITSRTDDSSENNVAFPAREDSSSSNLLPLPSRRDAFYSDWKKK